MKLWKKNQACSVYKHTYAYVFMLPAFLVLASVAFWPLLQVLINSFSDKMLFDSEQVRFVGLSNFWTIFKDDLFLKSVMHTMIFTVLSVSLETTFGMCLALLMHRPSPLRPFLRAMILIPWAIPTIISTKIWEWMLADVGGVVNYLLIKMGIVDQPVLFVSTPFLALITVVVVDVWKTTPFMALILLGGLQMVSQDSIDAGRLDGISPVRFFFKVVLPQLKGTLLVAISLRIIDAMRVFDMIYGLVGENPSILSIAGYIRQQMFAFQSLGVSSAAATTLLCVVSVVIYFLLRFRRQR